MRKYWASPWQGRLTVFNDGVATLMAGGSDPVITKKPEGAWTATVTDAMK